MSELSLPPSLDDQPQGPIPIVVRPIADLPLPEPTAGRDAYAAERELALAFSPRRQLNYQKYLASNRRVAQIDYLPIKLDIENVSRCNYRCTMCVVSDWPKGRRSRDMTLAEFRQLIDEQYGVVEIKLQGLGEPTMQGDDYFQMIQYARSQHIWVRTTTNSSLLHLKDNYKRLVDSNANEIQISIDGARKETFETIRRGAKFEQVMANCKLINDYCRQLNIARTKMWTVVQRDNLQQLEELVDLAATLGFTSQVFSLDLADWAIEEMRVRNKQINVEGSLEPERLWGLVERAAKRGVKLGFWFIKEKFDWASRDQLCPWPFERALISSDMRTVPCCMIGNPDTYELGKGKSFTETWQSDEYTEFRAAHIRGDIPSVCQGCYASKSKGS